VAASLEDLVAASVHAVAVTMVDNSGVTRVKGVPVARLERAAARGVGMPPVFDSFLADDGFSAAASPVGDLRAIPDLSQLTILAAQPGWAWAPADRRHVDGSPYEGCQRSFARRMTEQLQWVGLSALMAFEVEWCVSANESAFEPGFEGGAYGMRRLISASEYLADVASALEAQGVPVDQIHPEYAAGQFELSFAASDPVTAADRVVLVQATIAAVSEVHGLFATFAPVVDPAGVGNGRHLHFSVWGDGVNRLSGGSGPEGLGQVGEQFLAGVLTSLPALLAVGAPTVASHLRLQPQRWAAPWQCWGVENREAALRLIPGGRPEEANAELKVFDATANPYLAVGAVIAAGLDGLARRLTLPEPVGQDPASLSDEERDKLDIRRLPSSVDESLSALTSNPALTEAMGAALTYTFVAARKAEAAALEGATPDAVAAAIRWRH
jgi:glutamine synthetase